jgi:hypothetical protein
VSGDPRVVVLGIIGRSPFAGVAWQALHYLEGFRRAGCEVFYVEDTGAWPYDPDRNEVTDDPRYTVDYLGGLMRRLGIGDRWAYVAPDGTVYGMTSSALARLLRGADALVNVTGATVLRGEHLQVPVRMYVETDPVLPQIEIAVGRRFTVDLLAAHTHHFSFGENLESPDCPVPVERFRYRPSRQPVVSEWWRPGPETRAASNGRFTTVSSWRQSGKDVTWKGETYLWSKHAEFLKVVELPAKSAAKLELALACEDADVPEMLRSHGWRVVDAIPLSRSILPYRDYILGSRGEFTVAKDQYVRLRTGWFSDRSACYLAAGKPVVTQDTGFGRVLPTGRGLFAFRTIDEAVAALREIESAYEEHSRAAAEIAREYFEAEKVARSLLAAAGL